MDTKGLFEKAEQLREEEKLEESLSVYKDATKEAIAENNGWIEGESLHMNGLVNLQLNNYLEATRLLAGAKKKFSEMNSLEMVGAVLRDQAAVAVAENDFVLAESLLRESISTLAQTEKRGHLGMSKVKLGSLYLKQNNLEEAERLAQEGLEEIKDSEERFFESSAFFELAHIQKEMGDLGQSKLSGETALQILEDISTGDKHAERKKEMKLFIDRLG